MGNNLDKKLAKREESKGATVSKTPEQQISQYLQNDTVQNQIQMALPKGFTAERLGRIALSTIRNNGRLLQCSVPSLMSSILESAALGLMPGPLGHAYLIPYWNNRSKSYEAQFQIGYKGLLDLARRSGEISTVVAQAVHENDTFELEFGTEQKLRHIPNFMSDRGEIKLFYAYATLKDGGFQYAVMTKAEVDAIKLRSKGKDNGPWITDYEQMACKTVLKRLCKTLPLNVEAAQAVQDDTDKEFGNAVKPLSFGPKNEMRVVEPEEPKVEEGELSPARQELFEKELSQKGGEK